jgi:hypothetical protein
MREKRQSRPAGRIPNPLLIFPIALVFILWARAMEFERFWATGMVVLSVAFLVCFFAPILFRKPRALCSMTTHWTPAIAIVSLVIFGTGWALAGNQMHLYHPVVKIKEPCRTKKGKEAYIGFGIQKCHVNVIDDECPTGSYKTPDALWADWRAKSLYSRCRPL